MIPHILLTDEKKKAENYIKERETKDVLFLEVFPDGEKIKIEQIRALRKSLSVRFDKKICVIIWWFDKATVEAQNASLKMLEEYAEKIDFYLVVENPNKLLPTILSRAIVKDLRSREKEEIFKVQESFEDSWPEIKNKEQAQRFLNSMLFYLREKAKKEKDSAATEVAKEILKVMNYLENNNLNPQLSVDYVLIFFWKKYKIKI